MTRRSPPHTAASGAILVVFTLVGWASVPLFLRHFAESIDPWTSNGWRYGFSALLWAPVLIVVAMRQRLPHGLWKAALLPSVVNAAGQVCFTSAHYQIQPGLLTFGLRSQLIFVAIGAWILFPRERAIIRQPDYLLGFLVLILGMTGVVLMDPPTAETAAGASAAHYQGLALAIASGMLFACYGLAVRKYMHGVNSMIAFAAICQYTALAMVILMLLLGDDAGLAPLHRMSGSQIALLLLSAIIGIAIGHVFYYASIARLGVAVTAGVLQLQPFIVSIASMALFGETLSGWQWIGGCIAVCGALLMLGVQWRMSRSEPVLEEPVAIAEGKSGT